jgi:deoxyribose-phosphate aldolase
MQSMKQNFTMTDSFERDLPVDRRVIGPVCGVKVAGEILTCKDVLKMIAAGANRIGVSTGVAIFNGALGAAL